ncbi:phosphoinositide phosphatase SAC2 [Primulina tabacum]|uniref:phosphoinositide phosphatase SAC2 n=1 Tax=Primulina tabacum TaxID=48773 RepID=UPI003F593094
MGSMAVENEQHSGCGYLQKFRLYETSSNFYMIGRDKSRTCWKVLKINRLEQTELIIVEDSTTYSEFDCYDLLRRIHGGNMSTGGLKFVTTCYGIVGFIKFLGPYYMLLITKRRNIGTICGHAVYAIAKSEMIPIPNAMIQSNMAYSRNENRYKKLLRSMDLTKDFFFSYSYRLMYTLQKNMSNHETGQAIYETMFVWNAFLTRGIRSQIRNSIWTIALLYGFFKQVQLSISGRYFNFILIARRSRHYAGTRYLKRGVNEKGRVANDVEIEQIVLEEALQGSPIQMSSIVQNRGSIPLFWSQETSRLNIKPDIILSRKDPMYEATKLHFGNLVKRYGNPIIILNLIKTREKKPRESILCAEFAYAIEVLNKDLTPESRLKFLHWDLNKYSRTKGTSVLAYLVKVAVNALELTGFFCCQVFPSSCELQCGNNCNVNCAIEDLCILVEGSNNLNEEDKENGQVDGSPFVKPSAFQKGVLRTNCIDCLDRTNVAQYVYGLVALGRQLHAFGYTDVPTINLDSPLANDLMKIYEAMGDTLALQYGGSAAHNKIFSERRGQWKAATQSQEFLRTLQRYYSNTYMDAEKQDTINVFLGYFQPQQGKPALWELDSDQHYDVGRRGSDFTEESARSIIKRSLSDGNILCDTNSPIDDANAENVDNSNKPLSGKTPSCDMGLSELTPEISTCGSEVSFSRFTPSMFRRQLFPDTEPDQYLQTEDMCLYKCGDSFNCSNFLDIDWLSSSGNSCEDETYERSALIGSLSTGLSSGEIKPEASLENGSSSLPKGNESADEDIDSRPLTGFPKRFVQWVTRGDLFFP